MKLSHVVPLGCDYNQSYDVEISDDNGAITSITPRPASSSSDSRHTIPSLLLPPLCHPHVHLDKPYLLTSHTSHNDAVTSKDRSTNDESVDYSDLSLQTGTFAEALSHTTAAKSRYTPSDLFLRGSQLIAESLRYGVTSLRAFVEVDHITERKCLDAGLALQRHFADLCYVQICAFAQDPVFNTDKHGDENRAAIERVLTDNHQDRRGPNAIEVLGSTPYVEGLPALQRQNIDWAIDLAIKHNLHLDFHLDYNLDSNSEPMIWHVIETLKQKRWNERMSREKTVVIGHCSRMTLFSIEEMERLAREIQENRLPIHFVGLPSSDLFMMGRREDRKDDKGGDGGNKKEKDEGGQTRDDDVSKAAFSSPRGTLPLPTLIRAFNLSCALSINNLGNAFTPHGTADPLLLASNAVGVYQTGTRADARLLFDCVSDRARAAIGLSYRREESARNVNGTASTESSEMESAEEKVAGKEDTMVGRKLPLLVISNETQEIAIEIQVPIKKIGNSPQAVKQEKEERNAGQDGPLIESLDRDRSRKNEEDKKNEDQDWTTQKKNLGVLGRPRLAVEDVIWDPPETATRRLVMMAP